MGDFQAGGKGVHAADVGQEKVRGIDGVAADLGVEVKAACGKAAGAEYGVQGQGGLVIA